MKGRLVALGVVVMAAAIVFWIYSQDMTHSNKKMPVTHIPSELTEVQDMPESKPLDVPEGAGKKRSPEKAWGRDPFKLSPGVKLKVPEQGESPKAIKANIKKGSPKPIESPIRKVTAILITDSRKVASINHKVVTVGDFIDGEKVLEIKPDRVILEKGGRKQVIILEESPIEWTETEGKGYEK
jgi:hypothetical protein